MFFTKLIKWFFLSWSKEFHICLIYLVGILFCSFPFVLIQLILNMKFYHYIDCLIPVNLVSFWEFCTYISFTFPYGTEMAMGNIELKSEDAYNFAWKTLRKGLVIISLNSWGAIDYGRSLIIIVEYFFFVASWIIQLKPLSFVMAFIFKGLAFFLIYIVLYFISNIDFR